MSGDISSFQPSQKVSFSFHLFSSFCNLVAPMTDIFFSYNITFLCCVATVHSSHQLAVVCVSLWRFSATNFPSDLYSWHLEGCPCCVLSFCPISDFSFQSIVSADFGMQQMGWGGIRWHLVTLSQFFLVWVMSTGWLFKQSLLWLGGGGGISHSSYFLFIISENLVWISLVRLIYTTKI